MSKRCLSKSTLTKIAVAVAVVVAVAGMAALPPVREGIFGWFAGKAEGAPGAGALKKEDNVFLTSWSGS
jgi:hypothetical protein